MMVCHAATGSWTTPPWVLYARQYMPFDGPGIGPVQTPPPDRGFPPHLEVLYRAFLQSRRAHTVGHLPAEALRRLLIVAKLLPSWFLFPFALIGLFYSPWWMASVFALAYFALQLTFHVGGEIYYLDLVPWLFLLVGAGVAMAVRAALRQRRSLAVAACGAMSFAALWVLTGMTQEFYLVTAYASRRG